MKSTGNKIIASTSRSHGRRSILPVLALSLVATACGGTGSDDEGGDGSNEQVEADSDYPSRQIEIIVPFGAGGGVDINARALAPHLSEELGVNVVVENRTGAGGITGHTLGATAPPDGYTLTFVSPGIVGGPLTEENVEFMPTDYRFIGQATEVPNFVTVHAESEWHTVDDLITAAEADPGSLTTGRQASFTSKSIALELFIYEAGISPNVTTGWEGGAELLAALVTGDVDFSMADANELQGRDDLRPLCASAAQRSPAFPDTPTCAEEGLEGVSQGVWRGLAAPEGTPDEIVDILNDALVAALESTELEEDFDEAGLTIDYLDPEDFATRVDEETELLTPVFEELGVLVE